MPHEELSITEVLTMLRTLADNLTPATKRIAISSNTNSYTINVLVKLPNGQSQFMDYVIPLIQFFGMTIGYNRELDLLVIVQDT